MLTEIYEDISNRQEALISFLVDRPAKIDALELKRQLIDVDKKGTFFYF
jgi:hypothetical protein